jgi:glycosyltransferase involved in cell wall biosynthesis
VTPSTDPGHVLDDGVGARNGDDRRRPRVLIVATLAEVGGVGTYIAMLLPELVERFDVVVAAYGPGPLRDATLAAGARYVPLSNLRRPINPWRDLLAVAELARLCRRERPDIIHLNSPKAALIGRIAGALTRVPIRIVSIHGWSFSVPGIPRAAVWADRLVRPLTTLTICVSEYDRDVGIKAGMCAPERTLVIHNGIDAGAFEVTTHGERDVPVVVSVGRLAPQKDITTLVRALAELDRGSYRAVIAGSGPDADLVASEVERLQLSDSIDLLGLRDDVSEILASADVFVLSSIYECLPISVLEAMAAGLPVVATGVGGVPELVVEGETGFVVRPRDAEALAAALRRVLANGELRRRLGEAARARMENQFGVEKFRRRHLEVYLHELERHGLGASQAALRPS